ncbi:MAG: ATP synthase A1 subunit C [Thermoplasmata archaeon]|nr:MAG: ATP synthase A1 subunit C [Thermoplasmata archaeon]
MPFLETAAIKKAMLDPIKMWFKDSGNYPYVVARVKAKRKNLLPKETYAKFLMMSTAEISRSLGETSYRTEIENLGLKYSGADLVENALNLNMANTFKEILGFSKGHLHGMIAQYLDEWDFWNLKAIIRGIHFGAKRDEIFEELIPAGQYSLEFWRDVANKDDLEAVLEGLKHTEFYEPIVTAWEDYQNTKMLTGIETNLDKAYFEYLLSTIYPSGKAGKLFLEFIQIRIDTINLKTLFRFKFVNGTKQELSPFLLDGGLIFNKAKLDDLAESRDFDDLIDRLKPAAIYQKIGKDLEQLKEDGTLIHLINVLDKYFLDTTKRFAYTSPISILPVLDYFVRKEIEVKNIRAIVRGKSSDLPQDIIQDMLVI